MCNKLNINLNWHQPVLIDVVMEQVLQNPSGDLPQTLTWAVNIVFFLLQTKFKENQCMFRCIKALRMGVKVHLKIWCKTL